MPDPTGAAPIAVTGASGFVGQHVINALRRAHRPVVGWRHRPGDDSTDPVVDILDPARLREQLHTDAPAGLIHLAGAPHVGQSWQDTARPLRINAMGTHHVLNAARQHAPQCKLLVITSAMVYAPADDAISETHPLCPNSPYGVSKLAQDDLARRAVHDDGLQVVVARPFNHIGPGQADTFAISSFCRQIADAERGRRPPVLRVGNLDARRDLTDVRDVADAYVTLLDRAPSGSVWNVCAGTAYRIGDLLESLLQLARVPIRVEPDPERMRPADQPLLLGDASRLRDTFGWRPRYAITDTLSDMLAWWRAQA